MSKLEELGFELRHVGINCANEEEACTVADRFDTIFGFTKKIGNSSVFAGTAVEAMKKPYLWKKRTHCHWNYRCKRGSCLSGKSGCGV